MCMSDSALYAVCSVNVNGMKAQWGEQQAWGAGSGGCQLQTGVSAIGIALQTAKHLHPQGEPGQRAAMTILISLRKKPFNSFVPSNMWVQGPKWEPRLPSGVIRCSVAAGALSENLHPSLSSGDCFRASRFRAQIWGAVFLAFSIFSFVFRKPTWLKSGHEQIEPPVLPRLYKISLRSTCCHFSLLGVCCLRFT